MSSSIWKELELGMAGLLLSTALNMPIIFMRFDFYLNFSWNHFVNYKWHSLFEALIIHKYSWNIIPENNEGHLYLLLIF